MLEIHVKGKEIFEESTYEFSTVKDTTLKLEHSLVSVSRWEEKYKKPFLTEQSKTREETLYYIECMTINNNVDKRIYNCISDEDIERVNEYIADEKTATWFTDYENVHNNNSEQVTSELIYYWMTINRIPFETQKWHLSRLMTLIKICNIKNSPPKKMSERETLERYKQINEKRRKRGN